MKKEKTGAYDKRLDKMSMQRIFDKSKNHLLKQNKQSVGKIGDRIKCLYRGPDGLKCASGVFITDEDYNASLEGKSWAECKISQGLSEKKKRLISRLQSVHDNVRHSNWKFRLKEVAIEYKLAFNE